MSLINDILTPCKQDNNKTFLKKIKINFETLNSHKKLWTITYSFFYQNILFAREFCPPLNHDFEALLKLTERKNLDQFFNIFLNVFPKSEN